MEVGSIVRVPFGRQKLDGVVVGFGETSEVPEEKLVTPTAVREDPSRRTSSPSPCGWRTSTAHARARALPRAPAARPAAHRAVGRAHGRRARRRELPTISGRCWRALPRVAAPDPGALRRLEARGLVAIAPRGRRRAPLHPPARRPRGRRSRAGQRGALDALAARRRLPAARRHRLGQDRGVPAGGAARRSSAGEGVIVLVPEIALTPQTVGRFQARFGDTVALLHCGAQRGRALRRVAAAAHAARRGSPSARARRSSRRCATSG